MIFIFAILCSALKIFQRISLQPLLSTPQFASPTGKQSMELYFNMSRQHVPIIIPSYPNHQENISEKTKKKRSNSECTHKRRTKKKKMADNYHFVKHVNLWGLCVYSRSMAFRREQHPDERMISHRHDEVDYDYTYYDDEDDTKTSSTGFTVFNHNSDRDGNVNARMRGKHADR